MNIPPSEADKLDFRTYEAILHHWIEAHHYGDDEDAPDPVIAMKILDAANSNPALIH